MEKAGSLLQCQNVWLESVLGMMRPLGLAVLLVIGLGQSVSVAQGPECDWSIDLLATTGADSLVERLTDCLDNEALDVQARKMALKHRALSYALSGRLEEARADRAQIIRRFPEERAGWPLRAIDYIYIRTSSWGVGEIEEVLTLSQEMPGYHVKVGNAFYSVGEYDMALMYYQISLEREPRRIDADLNIGGINFVLGRYAEALESYDSALAKERGLSSAHFGKALTYYHLGDRRKAVEELRTAVRLEESNFIRPMMVLVLADLFLDLGEAEAAIGATNRAVAMDEENRYVGYVNRAIAYAEMDRLEEALSELDQAEREFGAGFANTLLRGDILCRAGQEREAEAQWASARSMQLDTIGTQSFAWRRKVLLAESGFYEGPIDFDFGSAARDAERRWVEASCPWLSVNARIQRPIGPTFRSMDR